MSRTIYRCLLRLHPPSFREQFADEMLWIYDQAAASDGLSRFFTDGFVSLVRQWLFRRGAWVAPAAIVWGLLQVMIVLALTSAANEPNSVRRVATPSTPSATTRYRDSANPTGTTEGSFGGPVATSTQDAEANHGSWGFIILFAILLVYSVPGVRRAFRFRIARQPALPGGRDGWGAERCTHSDSERTSILFVDRGD
jgi:hypothetical protein